eukprot:15327395-Ditylum_brightwellii.AAC.1
MEGAPLSYVIRKDDAAITNATELAALKTNHERLIKGAEMSGTVYETDNGKVFSFIKGLALNSQVYSFLHPFEATHDGRGALKTLDKHFQGDTKIGRSKDKAYAAIKAVTYTGETQNWGYEDYTTLHADNHQILFEAGEP